MLEIAMIGPDLAKLVFQVHGADASGAVVLRKTRRRSGMRFVAFVRSEFGARALKCMPPYRKL